MWEVSNEVDNERSITLSMSGGNPIIYYAKKIIVLVYGNRDLCEKVFPSTMTIETKTCGQGKH